MQSKDGVPGSIPGLGSKIKHPRQGGVLWYFGGTYKIHSIFHYMKKALLLALLAFGALGAIVAPLTVDALTDDQQNALTMLLRSFGADDSAIHDFQGAVLGATTGPTDDYGTDGTSTSGVYCPRLISTMQRGARDATTGGQVTELQLFLSDYFNLNEEDIATGFFGRLTQSYVVKFQQEKGLPSFGIVGSLTRAKIAEWCGKGQTGTTGTTPTTPNTNPTGTSPLPGAGTTGTAVGTGGTDANGLSYSLVLKGGSTSAEPSFIEGMEIGPFMLLVKNNSLLTQTVTFPNNCWYSYRFSDRGNGGRIIFDLASIQNCISAESATSKTFTLKPGDSFFVDVTHKFQTYHIPPGDYGMAVLLNTRSGSDTVAKLNFKVWAREPSTSKLYCSLASDKSSYVLGETITVKWVSNGAYATWYRDTEKDNFFLGGDKLAVSGSAAFSANVLGNPYLLMKVFDASGNQATCRLVIPVTSQTLPTTSAGITVTSPNGGEQWEIGQLNSITWAPYGYNPDINPARDVDVYLVDLNGFQVDGKVMDTGKASLHTYFNLGNYSNYAQAGQYYVKAVNRVTGATDKSDRPFTLLPRAIDIKVNGSDSQVTLYDNQPVSVTFTTGTTFTSCTLHGVRSTIGGATGISLTNSALTTAFNGYAWAQVPGSSTAIYITCTKADGTTRGDSVGVTMVGSSSAQASLQVQSPNGGEQFDPSQPMDIRFTSSGISSASLALYKNDQWKYWINKNVPPSAKDLSSVLFTWIPSAALVGLGEGDNAGAIWKIYVTGLKTDGTGYVDDKSDVPFTFAGSIPTQTNPVSIYSFAASATSVASGQPVTFTWSSNVSSSDVSYYGGFCAIWVLTDANQQIHLTGGSIGSPSGSVTYTPPMSGTYTIRCSSGAKDGSPMTERTLRVAVGSSVSAGVLHAVGVYEAQGAQHNFCYSKPGTVTVNLMQYQKTGTPVTLSLSAYEPVIWNINVPAGVNLQKVILSGYNVQSTVITGASPLVERYFYSDPANAARGSSSSGAFYDDRDGADSRYQTIYHWAGQTMCAATSGAVPVANRWYYNPGSTYFYAYQQGDSNYTNLAAKLQSLTGLPVKSFTGAYSGSSFTVQVDTLAPVIDYFPTPLP